MHIGLGNSLEQLNVNAAHYAAMAERPDGVPALVITLFMMMIMIGTPSLFSAGGDWKDPRRVHRVCEREGEGVRAKERERDKTQRRCARCLLR